LILWESLMNELNEMSYFSFIEALPKSVTTEHSAMVGETVRKLRDYS
jgi:hypothetical protein